MIPRITYTSEMLDEFITFITDAHRELTSQDEEKADEGSDDDEDDSVDLEIEAYNEYLLLTNAFALPIGTRIISDTNSIEIAVSQKTLVAMEEFSGLIAIELPNEVQEYPILEFIQIVKE
jgi:hypothetical protein